MVFFGPRIVSCQAVPQHLEHRSSAPPAKTRIAAAEWPISPPNSPCLASFAHEQWPVAVGLKAIAHVDSAVAEVACPKELLGSVQQALVAAELLPLLGSEDSEPQAVYQIQHDRDLWPYSPAVSVAAVLADAWEPPTSPWEPEPQSLQADFLHAELAEPR